MALANESGSQGRARPAFAICDDGRIVTRSWRPTRGAYSDFGYIPLATTVTNFAFPVIQANNIRALPPGMQSALSLVIRESTEEQMKVRTKVKAGGIATDPDSLNVIMATEF